MTLSQAHVRQRLSAAFRSLAPVDDAVIDAVAALAAPRTYAAGEWLLRGGERASQVLLLAHGLVREFYIMEDGGEHTRSFIAEGGLTGSLLDLLSGEPSITWLEALETTDVVAWPFPPFDALSARFPELHIVARRHAEALYLRKTRREYEMLALTAAERYARWRKQEPSLDARVSRRHLASYLGITPEHLSRLRRAS